MGADYIGVFGREKRKLADLCNKIQSLCGVVSSGRWIRSGLMEHALIIGASGGIGAAVAAALEDEGVNVRRVSRRDDGLEVTDPASVAQVMGAIEGEFDLIFIAIGVLSADGGAPEKMLSAITADAMAGAMAVNAIGPALILQHVPRLLRRRGPSVCAVLSARVGSIGDNRLGGWYSYRASKAALNQIVHGAAIEIGRKRKEAAVVALHPGTVATPFTADYAARHKTVPPEEAARNLITVIKGLTPEQNGGFYDYAGREIVW